jgi:hypothetical protein
VDRELPRVAREDLEDAISNLLSHGEWKHEAEDGATTRNLGSEIFDHWRIKALVRDPDSSKRPRKNP